MSSSNDPRLVSTMQVVGSYFVGVYFNSVYNAACQSANDGGSITGEFIKKIQAYVTAVKTDQQCYSDTIRDVHGTFIKTTRFTTLSFADFVDRVVSVFVPEEYNAALSNDDKDEILSSVVCDLVSSLAVFCCSQDMLNKIIDFHDAQHKVTIAIMQERAVDVQMSKRSLIHNQFLKKIGQVRDSVSMDVVTDMKKALRRAIKDRNEMQAIIDELKHEKRGLLARENKYRKLIGLLVAERGGSESSRSSAIMASLVPQESTIAERGHDVRPPPPQLQARPLSLPQARLPVAPPHAEVRIADAPKKMPFTLAKPLVLPRKNSPPDAVETLAGPPVLPRKNTPPDAVEPPAKPPTSNVAEFDISSILNFGDEQLPD